jgi:hypothetical protein
MSTYSSILGLKPVFTQIGGDQYVSINATWDGTYWNRIDVANPAWLWQYNVANNMLGETYKGATFWVAAPGANPVGAFTTIGGWLMLFSTSQYKDFTIGGNGIEIDGNGVLPYGRLRHALISSEKHTGILTNVYLDGSGRDDKASPSWEVAIVDDSVVISRA